MAGESFEQLLGLGAQRDKGGKTSVEGVGLNQAISEAQAVAENERYGQRVRARERSNIAAINARMAADKMMKEQYGTDDPAVAAQVKASGVFDQDAMQQMQLDPAGFRAKFDRVVQLTGQGGVQDAPDAPPRQFSVGTGAGGEQYFTNLTPAELKAQKHTADTIRGDAGPVPVRGLEAFTPGRTGIGGSEGAATEKPIEDVLFQGKLDQARAITEKPERVEQKAIARQKYFNEVFGPAADIREARARVEADLLSGRAGELGLDTRDLKAVDTELMKRGKSVTQISKGGLDKLMYKPWVKAGERPGQAADMAEPASVVNPGGHTAENIQVNQKNMMATNEAANALEKELPRELPRTFAYAKGTPQSKQAKGHGRGKGVMEDLGAYLEGENRAGYGESGAMGFAKDAAAFYGPRLPGDIFTAVATRGAGKYGMGKAKELTKLRSIENMFGLF